MPKKRTTGKKLVKKALAPQKSKSAKSTKTAKNAGTKVAKPAASAGKKEVSKSAVVVVKATKTTAVRSKGGLVKSKKIEIQEFPNIELPKPLTFDQLPGDRGDAGAADFLDERGTDDGGYGLRQDDEKREN